MRQKDSEEAIHFFQKLSLILSIVVTLIILLSEGGFYLFGQSEVVRLTKWMFPTLLFISLYGLNSTLLQCHNHFFLANLAPALCNVMWILGALQMRHSETAVAMVGLAKWVRGGFVLQWAVTALYLRKRLPLRGWLKGPLFHSGVRKLIQAFGLGTLGVGAVQINAFFDAIFARYASPSGPVYLWYANRIQQLALAVLGIAAVTTLVPILTRAIKGGDEEQGRKIYAFGGRRAVMLMIPMTFAIISLGSSAIQLIFGDQ